MKKKITLSVIAASLAGAALALGLINEEQFRIILTVFGL